jgi:hypothetical protein
VRRDFDGSDAYGDEWYYGAHETRGEGAPHVLLASTRRTEYAGGDGR